MNASFAILKFRSPLKTGAFCNNKQDWEHMLSIILQNYSLLCEMGMTLINGGECIYVYY